MNKEQLFTDLLDLYYGETRTSLEKIAAKYGISPEECVTLWQQLTVISEKFKSLPEYEPSQLSLNKIMAHAREKAAQSGRVPFWLSWFRPAYGWAAVLVIGFFSLYLWQHPQLLKNGQQDNQIAVKPVDPLVKERLFTTPLDSGNFPSGYRLTPKGRPYLNSDVSNASTGNNDSSFALDDDLDLNIGNKPLGAPELETLFFRARKFEKLGHYQEAVHDYQLISRYPQFEYQKAVPIALARCYERLGDKKSAISVLESYQKTYGVSDDVDFWIDQLKSETF